MGRVFKDSPHLIKVLMCKYFYFSLPCCLGEIPTKYHITIQKTITQTKATVKLVSENRSRFEKFAMPLMCRWLPSERMMLQSPR